MLPLLPPIIDICLSWLHTSKDDNSSPKLYAKLKYDNLYYYVAILIPPMLLLYN